MAPNSRIKTNVNTLIKQLKSVPKVVVVDLDYTLWPTYCEFYSPADNPPSLYPQCMEILRSLQEEGIKLALASRTPAPSTAKSFVLKLGLNSLVSSQQIYPGRKIQHLKAISQEIGVDLQEIIFFDDEQRNIVDAESIGVQAELVEDGFNWNALERGFKRYQSRQGHDFNVQTACDN